LYENPAIQTKEFKVSELMEGEYGEIEEEAAPLTYRIILK
jgi:hypothetical protein